MPVSVSRINKGRLREWVKALNAQHHVAAVLIGIGQDHAMGQLSLTVMPEMNVNSIRVALTRALDNLDKEWEAMQEVRDGNSDSRSPDP